MNVGQLLGSLRTFSFRFLLVSVVPTVILLLVVLTLVLSGAPGKSPDVHKAISALQSLPASDKILLGLIGAAVAITLHPMQFSMIQMLEGYWGATWLGLNVAVLASRRYQRKIEYWDKSRQKVGRTGKLNGNEADRVKAIYERSLGTLPASTRLMPTRLGNTLRAAEDFAGGRYSLDSITVIPRLHSKLAPGVASPLDDSRLQLDVSVRLCLVWLLATLISLAMLAPFPKWIWIPVGTYILAWLSYRAACAAAEGYGNALAIAIDLHRFDLLEALHLSLPRNYKEELSTNKVLTDVLAGEYIGSPPEELPRLLYRHAARPQPPDAGTSR